MGGKTVTDRFQFNDEKSEPTQPGKKYFFFSWKTFDVSERTTCSIKEMIEENDEINDGLSQRPDWWWYEDENNLPRPPDRAAGWSLGRRAFHGIGIAAIAAGQWWFWPPAHGLLLEFVSVGDGDGRIGWAVWSDGKSSGVWSGRSQRSRSRSIQAVQSVAEVGHESSAERNINSGNSGQSDRHFAGALSEAGAKAIASNYRVGR